MKVRISILLLISVFIGGCSVSDYVNRKKIEKYSKSSRPAIEKHITTACQFNPSRVERIQKYINLIRSQKQTCGNKSYSPSRPLVWNEKLYLVAQAHSKDMASNDQLSHTGSNQSSLSDRMNTQHYDWKAIAENIAAGTQTPEQTVDRWLTSSGHCYNLMNPNYTQIGMACSTNESSEYGIYWTLVLAKPN